MNVRTPPPAVQTGSGSLPPIPSPSRSRHVDRGHFRHDLARSAQGADAASPCAVFMVQVERLRAVAEQCGPEAERALLDVVDRRLSQELGPCQAECRADRSHIAILKEGCGSRQARDLGRRICAVLDRETFHWGSTTFRLAASVGVLELEERPARVDDLLERATEACEAACTLGNEGVVMLCGRPGERESLDSERDWREHLSEVL